MFHNLCISWKSSEAMNSEPTQDCKRRHCAEEVGGGKGLRKRSTNRGSTEEGADGFFQAPNQDLQPPGRGRDMGLGV